MDWLTFFASLVGSLAWPAALVGVVLVLRRSLNRLLPDLTRLKYKDLELEFGRQVAQAKIEIETSPEVKQLPERRQLELSVHSVSLTALARISPRAAVLEAWLPFEVVLSRVGVKLGLMNAGRPPLQMPHLIEALVNRGALTSDEGRAVTRLRELRNKVVHAPAVELPPNAVAEFAQVLAEVAGAMEQRVALLPSGAAHQGLAPDKGATAE
jgi:hypothetical protein